jgi:hypothetical protein
MLRLSRGLKPQVIHKQVLAGHAHGSSWQEPLAALQAALRDRQWQGAPIQVVLSNHFVRYVLVPWSAQLANRQERQAYVRHCFNAAYGDPGKHWDMRMSDAGLDKPSLASGIDQHLLASLTTMLETAGMPLHGIFPHLMMAANQSRRLLSKGVQWLVVVEASRLCMALLDHGNWKAVRSYPVGQDWRQELNLLLTRESVLLGDEHQAWPVLVYGHESQALPALPGRKVSAVSSTARRGLAADDDRLYPLAMRA